MSLEGPPEVAEAADALRRTTTPVYRAVEAILDGDPTAADRFDSAYAPFWQALRNFVDRGRRALEVM
ncbi:hypothetical protein ACWGJX_13130 [Streptomyces sp. NPDC054775]